DAVADEVRRGLVAGVEQKDAIVQKLELAQPLLGRFWCGEIARRDQGRENLALVALLLVDAATDQVDQIDLELRACRTAALELFPAQHRLERAQNCQRPAAQRSALVRRYAEHVAEQLHRDRGGEA